MYYTAMQEAIGDYIAITMAELVGTPDEVGNVCEPYSGMVADVSEYFGRPRTKRLFRDIQKAINYIKSGECRYQMTDGYSTL